MDWIGFCRNFSDSQTVFSPAQKAFSLFLKTKNKKQPNLFRRVHFSISQPNSLDGIDSILDSSINKESRPGHSCICISLCCCLLTQLCLTLCDPMDWSMQGFPVLNHLLEFVQIHVHWVGDAIQPSHSLSSPFLPAFNLSQYQDLFFSFLCNKVLLKSKGDRESFWHRHQKGAERIPAC